MNPRTQRLLRVALHPRVRERWQVRIVLWLAAGIAGLAVVAFAGLADIALSGFERLHARWPWAPLLLTPAIGMAVVWATRRFVPGAAGSGIPQVVAATQLAALDRPVSALLSLRIAIGKIVLGSIALAGGFSAGREGPSVQIAAAIMLRAQGFLPRGRSLRASDLIIAGGAAGIAAAFNTPLAGIVFAVEELGRRLEARTSGVLVSTIVIAGLVAIALEGNYTYFGQLTVRDLGAAIVLPTLVCGLLCGTLGGGFSWLLLWPLRHPEWPLWAWRKRHAVWFAGGCGLVVALLGALSGGSSFGSGYHVTSQAIAGQVTLDWHAPITRFLATIVTYFSGIPGGIFAPALAVGAALGADLAAWPGLGIDTHAWMALCMAGFLAAVTQSPITAAIIVMEMVNGHQMVISLMAASFLAKTVSGQFGPELYQSLSLGMMGEAPGTHAENGRATYRLRVGFAEINLGLVNDPEVRRLAVLRGTALLDSPHEACFDALVRCAAQLTGCPVSLMNLCDADRLWVKARVGTELQDMERRGAFCSHVVEHARLLEVRDAPNDPRFAAHPQVVNAPFVRYYAGAPLLYDGVALGSICVIDTVPRQLSEAQLGALQWLARAACEILQTRQRTADSALDSDAERRRLLDFARASGDWMWETDATLRYTWISGAYEQVTGETAAMPIGALLADGPLLDGAGQRLASGGHLHELFRAGQPFSRAMIEQAGADRQLAVSLSAVPVHDAAGRLAGWRGTARDVTAATREAQQQRSENELLAQVSANMPGLIYRFRRGLDGEGRFEFVNQQVGKVLGLTPAELLSDPRGIYKIVHPDDVETLQRRIDEADRLQQSADVEYRVVQKNGIERWVSSHSSRQRMPDGSLVSHGFIADATERKQIELALQESEQRWEIAANATGIGIAQLDLVNGMLQFDARACANHGLTHPHPRHALADWLDAIHPEDREAAKAALREAIGGSGRMEARYRFCRADGSTPWLEVVAQAERDGQGRVVSLIGTCRDVSAQIAVDALRRDKDSAERASRAKTEFLSRVSHELRTPLNGILGFAQLMALDRQHALPEVQQRRLEGVERSGQHLLALVNDVLDIARIEQDDFAPRLHAVDVAEVLRNALAFAQPQAKARGLQIDLEASGPCWAIADERSLRQVLTNLLSNAIKFNRDGGRVRIVAERNGEGSAQRLNVSVHDDGPGLSASQQAELFQPFNRLGAERKRIDGTGLGLVIARQLVIAMHGKLEVLSDGRSGCCFTLDLQAVASPHVAEDDDVPTRPSALRDVEADADVDTNVEPEPATAADAPHRQVLYIEDEALNRVLMEEVFRQQADWQLHTASDGAEGLALAHDLLPDLLLIDINLPDMTGLAVVQRLRRDPRTAALHCIALSADAVHEQIDAARNAGFDDYWTKPIDVAQLMRTLADTLAQGRRTAA